MRRELGEMSMPPAFRYGSVYLRGKPVHRACDPFRRRHPPMDPGHWAKIYAPFDALAGFSEKLKEAERSGGAGAKTQDAMLQ